MALTLTWCAFDALSPAALYTILELRCAVFIVEQNCAYADIDGKDPLALHGLARDSRGPIGCLRVFAPGVTGEAARIGRVAVAPPARGAGLGRWLMKAALAEIRRRHGAVPVELSAQSHLEAFYAGLGFVRISETYLEDGIPHCDMRRYLPAE